MKTQPSLHQQAETEREKGNFLEALKLYEEVIVKYQEEKNYAGIVDALQGKFLTYKHLFGNSKDIVFAELAINSVELALRIATERKLSTAFCFFNLGEAHMLFNDYHNAAVYYRESIAEYKDGPHIGRIRYHLGEALYRVGHQTEGKKNMEKGLKEVKEKAGKLGTFIKHVWESGCHMRLAQLLKTDSPEEAQNHIKQAQKIIEKDDRLILRKRQMYDLLREFQEY